MKIAVTDFIGGEGAQFAIKPDNEAERVLLTACVDSDILQQEDETQFLLTLPVSN